jgi:hypothetical protein
MRLVVNSSTRIHLALASVGAPVVISFVTVADIIVTIRAIAWLLLF